MNVQFVERSFHFSIKERIQKSASILDNKHKKPDMAGMHTGTCKYSTVYRDDP